MNNIKQKPNFKAIVFDMDGTLLNTLPDLAEAGNYTLTQMGFLIHTVSEYRYFIGNGINILIKRIIPENSSESQFKKALDIFNDYYKKNMFNKTIIYPGIIELLKELKSFGIKIGIVTNKPHEAACEITKFYFPDLIDATIGAKINVPTKPAPDALFEMMRILNEEAFNVLYVGDSGVDMQLAENAGVKSCGVLWGFRERSELVENGANYLAETAADLREIISND